MQAFVNTGINLHLQFESNAWSTRREERVPTSEFVDFDREAGKVRIYILWSGRVLTVDMEFKIHSIVHWENWVLTCVIKLFCWRVQADLWKTTVSSKQNKKVIFAAARPLVSSRDDFRQVIRCRRHAVLSPPHVLSRLHFSFQFPSVHAFCSLFACI
jgi:Core binding factor beta subunit